jgi:hypothetical protein
MPTPTPLPYEVTIRVADTNGAPLAEALVVVPKSGDVEPQTQLTDANGETIWGPISWDALSSYEVVFTAWAQGYLMASHSPSLEFGPNQIDFTLERDPHGILLSEACAPGETVIYVDDLQDQLAQEWEVNQTWSVIEDPDEPGDYVIALKPTGIGEEAIGAGTTLGELTFGPNTVVRVWFKQIGRGEASVNRNNVTEPYEREDGEPVFSSWYSCYFRAVDFSYRRWEYGPNEQIIGSVIRDRQFWPQRGEDWHFVELYSYDQTNGCMFDGEHLVALPDGDPLPPGHMSLFVGGEELPTLLVDDIVVCGLEAPFETNYNAEGETE